MSGARGRLARCGSRLTTSAADPQYRVTYQPAAERPDETIEADRHSLEADGTEREVVVRRLDVGTVLAVEPGWPARVAGGQVWGRAALSAPPRRSVMEPADTDSGPLLTQAEGRGAVDDAGATEFRRPSRMSARAASGWCPRVDEAHTEVLEMADVAGCEGGFAGECDTGDLGVADLDGAPCSLTLGDEYAGRVGSRVVEREHASVEVFGQELLEGRLETLTPA